MFVIPLELLLINILVLLVITAISLQKTCHVIPVTNVLQEYQQKFFVQLVNTNLCLFNQAVTLVLLDIIVLKLIQPLHIFVLKEVIALAVSKQRQHAQQDHSVQIKEPNQQAIAIFVHKDYTVLPLV